MEDNEIVEKKTWKREGETLKDKEMRKIPNDGWDMKVITGPTGIKIDTFFPTEADELNQLDEMEPDAEESSGSRNIEVGRVPRVITNLETAQQQSRFVRKLKWK